MSMRHFAFIMSLATLSLVAACGDDKGSTGNDATQPTDTRIGVPDTQPATEVSVTPDALPETTPETTSACDKSGFTAAAQDLIGNGTFHQYLAQSTLAAPVDGLNFELIGDNGGASAAGTYTLDDSNYKECGNCVIAYVGCDENLDNCQKRFLAQSGTLTIAKWEAEGGRFSGTLTNAKLVEVTIAEDLTSTVVADGDTWCIDSYAFDAEVQ